MIIGITGTNGSGKGTVVEYLVHKSFKHYSVREELIAEIKRRELPVDRSSMREVGNDLRAKHGAGYFMQLFSDQANHEGVQNIAIESIRSVGEAEAIKKAGGILLATDADREIRYERAVARGSETDKVTFEKFCEQEDKEMNATTVWDMNVLGVMKLADFTLYNNGTLEELHQKIDEILAKIPHE